MRGLDQLDRVLVRVAELERFETSVRVMVELLGRHDRVYLFRVVFRFQAFTVESFRGLDGVAMGPPHFAFRDDDVESLDLEATVDETGLTLREHGAAVLGEVRRLLDGYLSDRLRDIVVERLTELGLQATLQLQERTQQANPDHGAFCDSMISVSRSLTTALDAQNRVTRRKFDQLVDVLERIWLTFSRFDDTSDWTGSDEINELADRLQEVREELQAPSSSQPTTISSILELARPAEDTDEDDVGPGDPTFETRIAQSLAASHANAVSVQQRIDETCLRLSHSLVIEFERALAWRVSQMVARRIVTED